MIKSYLLKLEANQRKITKILEIVKEYRRIAKVVLNIQLKQFFKNGKFNKNLKLPNIDTSLSARYLQTLQYQVVSMLNSYISNRQNDFKQYVFNSNLDNEIKKQLLYINKYKNWFRDTVKMNNVNINNEVIKLSRIIIKQTLKRNKFPNTKYIQLNLDAKVADIRIKEKNKAVKFDYWIKLSTLDRSRPIYLPLKSNSYFESIKGELKNFCQINVLNAQEIEIRLLKDVLNKQNYAFKTDKIALDLGLVNLLTTNNGDVFGRNFIDYLLKIDKKIVNLQSELQRQKIRLKQSRRYKILVKKTRNYFKNEINRIINRIITIYKPAEIIIEKINFKSPKLSKKMNRILSRFGKRYIMQKLDVISQELGIKIKEVNPMYTSQTCSKCGYIDKKNRKNQSQFRCKYCGKKYNADVNAAKNLFIRSSDKFLSNVYFSKSKILDKLVKEFIERCLKEVSSCPLVLTNPYFKELLNSS